MNPLPPVERLNELLAYDPETGIFTWKIARRGKAKVGSVAGRLDGQGYRQIKIDGVRYKAHRLAWKMMAGGDPPLTIDHKNNRPDDNRIENLREATRQQQNMNRTAHGSSKYLGVSWKNSNSKWHAQIRVNGKVRYLGYFTSEIEAARAYDCAAAKHHGEFANINFDAVMND